MIFQVVCKKNYRLPLYLICLAGIIGSVCPDVLALINSSDIGFVGLHSLLLNVQCLALPFHSQFNSLHTIQSEAGTDGPGVVGPKAYAAALAACQASSNRGAPSPETLPTSTPTSTAHCRCTQKSRYGQQRHHIGLQALKGRRRCRIHQLQTVDTWCC